MHWLVTTLELGEELELYLLQVTRDELSQGANRNLISTGDSLTARRGGREPGEAAGHRESFTSFVG